MHFHSTFDKGFQLARGVVRYGYEYGYEIRYEVRYGYGYELRYEGTVRIESDSGTRKRSKKKEVRYGTITGTSYVTSYSVYDVK